jgi:uncharacterized membrane protein
VEDLDLAVAIVAAIAAALVVGLDMPMAFRLPVGLAMALAVPGYVASMVLFPPGELRGIERAALAFSLSLGLAVLAAPFLDALPGGVTPLALVSSLTTFTILAAIAARWRRRRALGAGEGSRYVSMAHPAYSRITRPQVVAAGVVGVAIGLAAVLGSGVPPPVASTEFFIVPPKGETASLPKRVTAGAATSIQLGITNRDGVAREFRVVVLSGATEVATVPSFTVQSGATWLGSTTFTLRTPGDDQIVRFLLLEGTRAEAFRLLSIELDVVAL